MFVKICGITRLEDARAALDAGAGAIGFILWPGSPRFVDPEHARTIVSALPPSVTTVGVFVDQPSTHVLQVAERIGLSAIQLHGDETPEYASPLGDRQVIKALPVFGDHRRWPARFTILLDAHDPVRKGGTGTTIVWTAAAAVASERRVLLAGGITPENVADAIAQVNPFGIDVSSGVEVSPGVKSPERIRALFEAVRRGTGNHATRS